MRAYSVPLTILLEMVGAARTRPRRRAWCMGLFLTIRRLFLCVLAFAVSAINKTSPLDGFFVLPIDLT